MIKVKVLKENDFYKEITITGHANYDSYGKDIVCSSVSSIVITTVNAIISLNKDIINYDDNTGVKIKVLKEDEVTNKLLENMLNLLHELQKDYEKTIKFL